MRERMFKKTMLEYFKVLLLKMSFHKQLFRKEYRKSFQYLTAEERRQLKEWLRQPKG